MSLLGRIVGRFFGKPLRAQVDKLLATIRVGIALSLLRKYIPQFGDEKASALAAAVPNEIFGAKPANELGRQFQSSNRELIETQVRELKGDAEICYIVSLASHTLANIAGGTGTVTGEMLNAWYKLDELGIMLPIEKIRMPSSINELTQQANEFAASAQIKLEEHRSKK